MSNNEKQENTAEIFNNAFGDLLNVKKETPAPIEAEPKEDLGVVLFGPSEETYVTDKDIMERIQDYIPESVGSEEWEAFASRNPLPPIEREQEARAVSIGLQELRKMKEYMLYIHRHTVNEFTRVYATFPLLLSKDFSDNFDTAHKNIIQLMEDMEHLVAGDINQVEAVKDDYKLFQTFEEKRLSILYDILEHYNNK